MRKNVVKKLVYAWKKLHKAFCDDISVIILQVEDILATMSVASMDV